MSNTTVFLTSVAAALAIGWSAPVQANEVAERFSFEVPNPPESTVDGDGAFQITLNRWSEDAERDRVRGAASEDTATVLGALRQTGAVGYMRWPGGTEYTLRYARQSPRPDGGTDVVLLADRPLWVWWSESGVTPVTDYPFTLIQMRLGSDGKGEARSSLTTTVAADEQFGIALSDAEDAGVILKSVRRERQSS